MTFFLPSQTGQISVQARGTDTPPTSLWGGISASFQRAQLESNSNFRHQRENKATAEPLARQALEIMGDEPIKQHYAELGIDQEITPEIRDAFLKSSMDKVLSAARKDQEVRPEMYDFDISEEAVEGRTNERLQKEHQDLTETMEAMPGSLSATVAEIVGGIAGATTDIRNLPFLVAGGGTGSFARIMGREAMLNVAAEGATMPDRFKMAERLDIPEPDVAMTLAYAAAGGAVLGAGVEGLARGITYWRGTRKKPVSGVKDYEVEMKADIAEDALTDLRHPFPRISDEVKYPFSDSGINRQSPPFSETRIRQTTIADDAVSAPPPRTEPRPDLFDDPEARGGVGERQTDLEDLIAEARERDAQPVQGPVEGETAPVLTQTQERDLQRASGGSKPLIDHVKRQYGGIQPGTRLAEELKARGITSKTAPGLFRKAGRDGFDNIPASEEPHLAGMLGEDGNGYLNEQALADAITAEVGGTPTPVTREQVDARAELDARREWQDRLERQSAANAGAELDEQLFRMPEAPEWVDNPREREAIADYKTDDLRTHIEQAGDIFIGDRPASSILDELDADDNFAEVIALCGRRRTA